MFSILSIFIIVIVFIIPNNSYAYIGPGLGLSTVGIFFGIILSIILGIFSIFWYPIKRIFKGKKKAKILSKNIKNKNKTYDTHVLYLFIIFVFYMVGYFTPLLASLKEDFFNEIHEAKAKSIFEEITVWTDQPDKVHNGYNLVSGGVTANSVTEVRMIDNKGKTIHSWHHDLSNLTNTTEYKNYLNEIRNGDKVTKPLNYNNSDIRLADDNNGDLLVSSQIEHGSTGDYEFSKLSRIDSKSKEKWSRIGHYHHEFALNNKKQIIAINSKLYKKNKFLHYITDNKGHNYKYIDIIIEVIDSETGKLMFSNSLHEALLNSNFGHYISVASRYHDYHYNNISIFDPYHVNSVAYVEKEHAEKIDFLEEGDFLISMRNQSLLLALRPSENKIIWVKRGPWASQHNLKITDDGKLRIFDNEGFKVIADKKFDNDFNNNQTIRARLLEYDPNTEKTRVLFKNTSTKSMSSTTRSLFRELNDKSLIITSNKQGRILQVDKDGNFIWELRGTPDRNKILEYSSDKKKFIISRFYTKEEANLENWK